MSKVTTLYVNQITTSVTEEQLRECFSPYGEITKCHIVRNTNSGESRGFAFIDYAVCPSLILTFLSHAIRHESSVMRH